MSRQAEVMYCTFVLHTYSTVSNVLPRHAIIIMYFIEPKQQVVRLILASLYLSTCYWSAWLLQIQIKGINLHLISAELFVNQKFIFISHELFTYLWLAVISANIACSIVRRCQPKSLPLQSEINLKTGKKTEEITLPWSP
jgi:hypothetical protein